MSTVDKVCYVLVIIAIVSFVVGMLCLGADARAHRARDCAKVYAQIHDVETALALQRICGELKVAE